MKYVYYALIIAVVIELALMTIKGIRGPSKNLWAGGNGCNLIGGKKREPCCTPHDHAYKQGGWIGARWDADAALFSCIWGQGASGKFIAPVMWVGARYGGPFAYQYGKHRDIPIEVIKE